MNSNMPFASSNRWNNYSSYQSNELLPLQNQMQYTNQMNYPSMQQIYAPMQQTYPPMH